MKRHGMLLPKSVLDTCRQGHQMNSTTEQLTNLKRKAFEEAEARGHIVSSAVGDLIHK